jgi:uncharacterized protein YyaL (SSP411 family)
MTPDISNRLINEKSPYLLQHADNPVDWYPWGDEAFEKARKEDKPIFLSIGYSTCHWCHVMEHESFEDEAVAKLMNSVFISIKVDREERPDIDNIYMTVCRLMTGGGGWPLTIIMTPDKKPFFAGTYIPRENRYGRLGMLELIPRIKEAWVNRRDDVLGGAEQVIEALRRTGDVPGDEPLDESILHTAFREFQQGFDERHGGFGNAPKFPTPHNLLFLLRYWRRTGREKALDMVEKTLQALRRGGIYDHVGSGFHRYSTDDLWLVPHFEKMLYDQALMAMAYTEAFQATRKEEYKKTVMEIMNYVLRDMTDVDGGFYSAEDADSEGEEGRFYVWRLDEMREALPDGEARLVIDAYNIQEEGNFHDQATGASTGLNILHLRRSLDYVSSDLGLSRADLEERMESALKKLFQRREKRIHPHKDDKILTDWNGLMIAAMAKAGRALDQPLYVEAAERAAGFIRNNLMTGDGRLLHRYRDGQAGISGNIDDYSFFVWGLIELYEATFDVEYLDSALQLNEQMVDRFLDVEEGGFFFTPADGEELLVRQKEIYDGAVPSGNSAAAYNLIRLAGITGNMEFDATASKIGGAFSNTIRRGPSGFTMFLTAFDMALGPSYEVVIVGEEDSSDTKMMLEALNSAYMPDGVVILKTAERESRISEKASFVNDMKMLGGGATAYVCRDFACNLPTTDVHEMLRQMSSGELRDEELS